MSYVFTTTLLIVMLSCTTGGKTPAHKAAKSTVFPVDRIIAQSMSQNLQLLGKPLTSITDFERDSSVVHSYEKQGYQLVITYSAASLLPREVFISTLETNYPDSLHVYYTVAHVNPADSSYRLIPYKSMNDLSLFYGLAILPADSNAMAQGKLQD